jgi:hypothetical protein
MQQLRRKIKSRKFWLRKNMNRGKRQKNMKQKLLYNFSSKLQSLGPGSSVINITSHIDQDVTGLSHVYLPTLIGNSKEWKKYKDDYQLYKIEQIAVTIYPNDALDNEPTYINLDWFGNIDSADGIKYSDSTKIVYNDLKKIKSFFFKPPNILMDNMLLRKFNKTTTIPTASVYFLQTSGKLRGRIDIRIVFKVPTEYVVNNKIQLEKVEDLAKLDENKMVNENLKIINNNRVAGIHQESFSIISGEEEEKEEEKLEEDDEEELPKTIIESKEDTWSLFEQICKEDEEKEKKKKEKNRKKMLKRKERRKKKKEKLAALEKNKKIKKLKEKYEEKLKELKNKEKQLEENKIANKAWKEHNFYVAEGLANQKNELKREAAQLKKYKDNVHRQEEILNEKKKKYLSRKYALEKKYPSFNEEKQQTERARNLIKFKNQSWYEPRKSNESFSYQSSNKRKGRVCHADKSMSVSQAFDESSWYA